MQLAHKEEEAMPYLHFHETKNSPLMPRYQTCADTTKAPKMKVEAVLNKVGPELIRGRLGIRF